VGEGEGAAWGLVKKNTVFPLNFTNFNASWEK